MAYSRFSNGDVYMYAAQEAIICCMCNMNNEKDKNFTHRKLALEHLQNHRNTGHVVEERAFSLLREEIKKLGVNYLKYNHYKNNR